MSNPSLKEQLKTLSEEFSIQKIKEKKEIGKPVKPAKLAKQKPAWLEHAQYGVELLKAYFPNCFKELKDIQPVKIGIKQDLVKQLSTKEDIVTSDKACMVNSLAYYVNSLAYHKSVIPGATRIDLEGQAAGTISVEEAKYSAESRKSKLQKKQSMSHNMSHPIRETVKDTSHN